jgi:hypothetical protein
VSPCLTEFARLLEHRLSEEIHSSHSTEDSTSEYKMVVKKLELSSFNEDPVGWITWFRDSF